MSHPEESHRSPSIEASKQPAEPHVRQTHTPQAAQAAALGNLAQQLRRHSALEDLGPLFGAEAQGRSASAP